MNTLPKGYDAWRLAGPDDACDEIGNEEGELCNRYPEPDEDQPRGYRPSPCTGIMLRIDDDSAFCDTCGEMP